MRQEAKDWDARPRNKQQWRLVPADFDENGQQLMKEVPVGRPCDWCGQVVEEGWIHKQGCMDQERQFYLDILYG